MTADCRRRTNPSKHNVAVIIKKTAPHKRGRLFYSAANTARSASLGDQPFVLLFKLIMRFFIRRIDNDAVDRTHFHALRFLEVADAFGAELRLDDVDLLALGDGPIRALGLAH